MRVVSRFSRKAGGRMATTSGSTLKFTNIGEQRTQGVHGILHRKLEKGGLLGDPNNPKSDPPKGKKARILASRPKIPTQKLIVEFDKFMDNFTPDQQREAFQFIEQAGEDPTPNQRMEFANLLTTFGADPENIHDETFVNEFNRTRQGFEKNFPGGVTMFAGHGPDWVRDAMKGATDEDLIIMDHSSPTKILGVPIEGEDNLGSILGENFGGKNCYLGVCYSSKLANTLRHTGLKSASVYAKPSTQQYFGPNTANIEGSFEDFFFGLSGYDTLNENAKPGRDFVKFDPLKETQKEPLVGPVQPSTEINFINSF